MSKLVIVGVGALGSHLALLLRNLPLPLVLVDDDRVEAKNVLSQFHTRMGLGRNKAQALQQSLKGLFGVDVSAIPHRLTQENVAVLLGEATLVVDCLDNGASRRLIQDFVRARTIPCLHGALAADGQFGRAVWSSLFVIDEEGAGVATCEDGEHLPFIVTTASYLAASVRRFLATGEQVNFNIFPEGVSRF